ncbi:hypothetical protein QYE76_039624 [Lolium multiflorum]|uniref:Uncharacterized protein n=1 Tax=Lolium multiflorum TaxID=4521 RepID=A0AAD8TBU6_LOLMU|nr:hypothetical protein QYE76_039624 [Lolium multiflorum]
MPRGQLLFSAIFGFRNPSNEIFSESDEINAQVPIFTGSIQNTREGSEKGDRATKPHPGAARGAPPMCAGIAMDEVRKKLFSISLSGQHKDYLDACSEGSFTSKEVEARWDLLDRIEDNAEGWENNEGYADKPPFKPLPPEEGNEEKEKEKKKKGTKKKKKNKGNKKKEVTAYPRVYEITIGNRKYVAPDDYCDNESEYDDLPMPFTYISNHDLNEHTTFDIANLWEINSENDDDNDCHSVSAIHASSHNDIESSKLGEEVFENPFATGHYVLDTSPSNNNDDQTQIATAVTVSSGGDGGDDGGDDDDGDGDDVQLDDGDDGVDFPLPEGISPADLSPPESSFLSGVLRPAEAAVTLRLNFSSRNLLDSAAGGTFMSITLGEATKLLDNMMINYSEWHTERAPQGKKVNSIEETSSLSDKIDAIMSMLVNDRTNVDPNNVPLASLVAQEEHVDVNFIKNNNFNNNAYRNNSSNNYRPYPYNNGNGYGNSYGNSYNNNRNTPPGLEAMLKEFISTQTAFNKSVEEKLGKIDILASKVDSLAADVDLLKLKVMPNENHINKIVTTSNAIQVRINENIRLMAELRARWEKEENEKGDKIAKVWTITTTSNANAPHVAAPPTINGKIIGVGNVSTSNAKREKLPETAKTAETACDKTAEIFSNIGDNDPIALDYNGLDFDDCHISEVIKFLQKLAKSPNASAINLAFTKHITNALIKAREEKLNRETSIPRKLEDGWEPIIKMKVNDFDCNALCDLGASISVMPRKIYNMLDLPPLKNCYLDVNLADNSTKKPLGRVDNVCITVNNNLVPVDFVILDIECNASCPIILGRPFLRTVGAIIDMKEGNIKYQFPLKKGMEHFPRKRMKLPFDSIIRTNYDVDASSLDNT